MKITRLIITSWIKYTDVMGVLYRVLNGSFLIFETLNWCQAFKLGLGMTSFLKILKSFNWVTWHGNRKSCTQSKLIRFPEFRATEFVRPSYVVGCGALFDLGSSKNWKIGGKRRREPWSLVEVYFVRSLRSHCSLILGPQIHPCLGTWSSRLELIWISLWIFKTVLIWLRLNLIAS